MAHPEWHSLETVSEDTNKQNVAENYPNCTLNQSSSYHYIPFTDPSNISQDQLLTAPDLRHGSFSDSLEQHAHPATVYKEIWPLFKPDPGQAAYIFDSTHLGAGYTPMQSPTWQLESSPFQPPQAQTPQVYSSHDFPGYPADAEGTQWTAAATPEKPSYAATRSSKSDNNCGPRNPHLLAPPLGPSEPHTQIQLTEVYEDHISASSERQCSHCNAKSTPLWRRDPHTHKTLCNACGLYLAQHRRLRPRNLFMAGAGMRDDEDVDVAEE